MASSSCHILRVFNIYVKVAKYRLSQSMRVTDQGARYTNVKEGKYSKQLLGRIDTLSAEQTPTQSVAVLSFLRGLIFKLHCYLDHNPGD